MKKSKKELQFELDRMTESNTTLTDIASYERNNCSIMQATINTQKKHIEELTRSNDYLTASVKNLKQVVQNLGDCIAHL